MSDVMPCQALDECYYRNRHYRTGEYDVDEFVSNARNMDCYDGVDLSDSEAPLSFYMCEPCASAPDYYRGEKCSECDRWMLDDGFKFLGKLHCRLCMNTDTIYQLLEEHNNNGLSSFDWDELTWEKMVKDGLTTKQVNVIRCAMMSKKAKEEIERKIRKERKRKRKTRVFESIKKIAPGVPDKTIKEVANKFNIQSEQEDLSGLFDTILSSHINDDVFSEEY